MVPNDFSQLQRKALALDLVDREYWFAPPDHLHYFNTENIDAFMERYGLDVVDRFADFPIELFLFHPGSNYVLHPGAGKSAHQARLTLDLLIRDSGIDNYLEFCRSMTRCGLGRNILVIVKDRAA